MDSLIGAPVPYETDKCCQESKVQPITRILADRIASLEAQLAETKEALAAVEKEPKIIEVLDTLRRIQRRL